MTHPLTPPATSVNINPSAATGCGLNDPRNCCKESDTPHYDADGHTTSRVDPSGTTTYTFDHLNRLTNEHLPNDTTAVSSSFDPVGNRLTYTDRTGTVTYAYDADNELTSEADPGGSCTSNPTSQCSTFTYDTNGNRLTANYPGGTVLTTHSDTSSRHDEAKAVNGSTTLFDYRYSYANSSGKDQAVITSRTNALVSPNQSLTYSYNNEDELTGAVQNTGSGTATTASWLYCYDPAGNRTGDTTTIGATTCPTTAGSESNTYGYDPSGALTSRNGSWCVLRWWCRSRRCSWWWCRRCWR